MNSKAGTPKSTRRRPQNLAPKAPNVKGGYVVKLKPVYITSYQTGGSGD